MPQIDVDQSRKAQNSLRDSKEQKLNTDSKAKHQDLMTKHHEVVGDLEESISNVYSISESTARKKEIKRLLKIAKNLVLALTTDPSLTAKVNSLILNLKEAKKEKVKTNSSKKKKKQKKIKKNNGRKGKSS
mmetsp:Transcript_3207/g.4644  ORF Transcript_3207/g.4644 Transcript_3207/m.4644 type:complete len:131 (-) Transcript_3207:8-400(-)